VIKIGVHLWKLSQNKTGVPLFWTTLYIVLRKGNFEVYSKQQAPTLEKIRVGIARGVATGGVYWYIYPPNQSTLNFLCGCFVSLTQDKFNCND